jgi:hypothetical protein
MYTYVPNVIDFRINNGYSFIVRFRGNAAQRAYPLFMRSSIMCICVRRTPGRFQVFRQALCKSAVIP